MDRIMKEAGPREMIDSSECNTNQVPGDKNPGSSCFDQSDFATQNRRDHDMAYCGSEDSRQSSHGHLCTTQANSPAELHDNFPESQHKTRQCVSKHKATSLRTNNDSLLTQLNQTLLQFQPMKCLGLTMNKHLTNQRRDKTVRAWNSLYWVILLVSWQITGSLARPSTQELMHLESRLDIIERLDSESASSQEDNDRRLFSPEGRDRSDWLSCHGQTCEDWNKVQRILTELHLIDLNVEPASVGSDGPLSNLFLDLISGPAMESAAGNNELTRPWEGTDILLTLQDAEELYMEVLHKVLGGKRRRKRKINRDEDKRWELPIVYKMDGSHNAHEESMISEAISLWEKETCVRFSRVEERERVEQSHLVFTRGQYSCASYVGKMRFGKYNPQPVNLGSSCFEKLGVPVHEIGHALGLWHEHQRPIRDQHIKLESANIFFWAYNNFMAGSNTHVQNYGVPYDYNSVMHYGTSIGSRNGRPTLRPLDTSFLLNMGQREELSFLDSKVVNRAYCGDTCGTSAPRKPCQNGGYQDPNHCEMCRCPDGLSGDDCTQVAPSNKAECGGRFTLSHRGDELHLETPGHSAGTHYVYGTQCNWLIETSAPQHRLALRFEGQFNLMCEFDTCSHWVEVKSDSDLSENGPRFCCSHRPESTITSDTGKMVVIFKSIAEPRYENYIGFHAVVTLVTNEVLRDGEGEPAESTNNVFGWGIEPTTVTSEAHPVPDTETPDSTPITALSTAVATDNTNEEVISSSKQVERQESNNQTIRKKKKRLPKSQRKIVESTTETTQTPVSATDTIVTGTWHIQTARPDKPSESKRILNKEANRNSNHEPHLLTTVLSTAASQTPSHTEIPEPTPNGAVTSQTSVHETDVFTTPATKTSRITEMPSVKTPKRKNSKRKQRPTRISSTTRRRKQKSERIRQTSSKQNERIVNNEEVVTISTPAPVKQKQNMPIHKVIGSNKKEQIETTIAPITHRTHRTTDSVPTVTEKHQKAPTTTIPIVVSPESKHKVPKSGQPKTEQETAVDWGESSNIDDEGSTMFLPAVEESSTTQNTKLPSGTSTTETISTTVKEQATPRQKTHRTYWRTKKPNMKLVLAARRRAARRRVELRRKLLEEVKKRKQQASTMNSSSESQTDDRYSIKHSRHTDNRQRGTDSNHPNSRMHEKNSAEHTDFSSHSKETVTITSSDTDHSPYTITFFKYNTTRVIPPKTTITHNAQAPRGSHIAQTKPNIAHSKPNQAQAKPSIAHSKPNQAQAKPSIAQSNTIDSAESSEPETIPGEEESVSKKHSTTSTSQPSTTQSSKSPTTTSTQTSTSTTESTSVSLTTREPSTTSSSRKPTTSSSPATTPTTGGSRHTESSTTTTTKTAPVSEAAVDTERWTDWSACLGMDCKCGGCSWRIKYKLCGDSPCQGQEMQSERKPCDRVCGPEDTEWYWVARFYTRQCSECCGGFVREGDKCVLKE